MEYELLSSGYLIYYLPTPSNRLDENLNIRLIRASGHVRATSLVSGYKVQFYYEGVGYQKSGKGFDISVGETQEKKLIKLAKTDNFLIKNFQIKKITHQDKEIYFNENQLKQTLKGFHEFIFNKTIYKKIVC